MLRLKWLVFLILCPLLVLQACSQPGPPKKNLQTPEVKREVVSSNINLAIAYLNEKDYEKALEKLDKAKEADPNYAPIYNMYGLLYQQLEQPREAEKNFRRAIRLDSSDSSTLNNYGRFLCQQNQVDEAEEAFLKAAGNPLYKTPEIALTNAGLCLDRNDQKEQAEEYYRKALQIDPKIPQALLGMCAIRLGQNNHLSARGYLSRYMEVARHTPRSLWMGIQIETVLGDKDAVSSYALLLRNSFPDSDEAGLLYKSGIQ